MNKDIRNLKDNKKYVYGYFPLGSAKVSTSNHAEIVHDIRAAGVDTFVKSSILYFATPVNSCDLPIENADMVTLLSSGLFINDLPVGCQLLKTQLTDFVPVGISNSTIQEDIEDPDSAIIQKTWAQWFEGAVNRFEYRESNDGLSIAFKLTDYTGRFFNSDQWIILMQAGITFMSWDDYSSLLNSDNYITTIEDEL